MRSVGDVVAVYFDNRPAAYARIEKIEPDTKKAWLQVHLLFLSFPPQKTTWIVREEYLEGTGFTMNEIPVKVIPLENSLDESEKLPHDREKKTSVHGEVVSFEKYRKKKE